MMSQVALRARRYKLFSVSHVYPFQPPSGGNHLLIGKEMPLTRTEQASTFTLDRKSEAPPQYKSPPGCNPAAFLFLVL